MFTNFSPSSGVKGSSEAKIASDPEGKHYEQFWDEGSIIRLKAADLRSLLKQKGLSAKGNKSTLRKRLIEFTQAKRKEELERLLLQESHDRSLIQLEEQGCVYSFGRNDEGQLGLESSYQKSVKKPIAVPRFRGRIITQLSCFDRYSVALSRSKEVFTWPQIIPLSTPKKKRKDEIYESPEDILKREAKSLGVFLPNSDSSSASDSDQGDRIIKRDIRIKKVKSLSGEEIAEVSAGYDFIVARSKAGDEFFVGEVPHDLQGKSWRIRAKHRKVDGYRVPYFKTKDVKVIQVCGGKNHMLSLTETKRPQCEEDVEVFSWTTQVPLSFDINRSFCKEQVTKLACSCSHFALITSAGKLYTWGNADYGKLGHEDMQDWRKPQVVKGLPGSVIDVSLGHSHTCCVVQPALLENGGLVYSFGSNFYGQLAACTPSTMHSTKPVLSRILMNMRVYIKKIRCGSNHVLGLSVQGRLFSWGSDLYGELGRKRKYNTRWKDCSEAGLHHTWIPGLVEEFARFDYGQRVGRVGRGPILDFAAGDGFSLVSCREYRGPTEEELKELLLDEEEREAERLEVDTGSDGSSHSGSSEAEDLDTLEEKKQPKADLYTGKKCSQCSDCVGFDPMSRNPNMCAECKCRKLFHTI